MSTYEIEVCPDATAKAIREYLRNHPEIAKDKYEAVKGRVDGHCYVASESYYHASGRDLDIYCLSLPNGTHWYLGTDRKYIDLSIERAEFGEKIPYQNGRKRAFITGYEPSKRCETVLEAIEHGD